jgi:hypothetical protein
MSETLRERILEKIASEKDNIWSIKDLSKTLNSAYSHTHKYVQELAKDRIVLIQKIGNVSIIKLNSKEPATLATLALISYKKTKEWQDKDTRSQKMMERIIQTQDHIHCALIKSNRIILVVPEHITGIDLSMFQNRSQITAYELIKNRQYYQDCVILHGAEKYWSMILNS